MALADLLSRMEGRASDTPDTACNPSEVSAEPAPNKACTLDTSDTPRIINAEDEKRIARWLLSFIDADELTVLFVPPVTHAEAMTRYPDAVAAEPLPDRPNRKPTKAEAEEITALVKGVFASDSAVDRNEALSAALADPDGALRCYRAIAKERGLSLPDADDDRRTCSQCLNLRGRVCSIAKPERGALVVANQGYQPAPDTLQRCAGYLPNATDTDQRPGRERWPEL